MRQTQPVFPQVERLSKMVGDDQKTATTANEIERNQDGEKRTNTTVDGLTAAQTKSN